MTETPTEPTLRDDAMTARDSDHVAAARAVLTDVLVPRDMADVTPVLPVTVTTGLVLVVFSAADRDDSPVHLAVQLPTTGDPGVHLVVPDGSGGWTDKGAVTSLSQLGDLLITADPLGTGGTSPEQPVEWYQRYSPDGWPKDSVVTYDGKTWTSTVDNNTWTPGAYGWTVTS